MQMTRAKKPLHIYIDPAVLALVDAWIASQPVPPSRTAVVEQALREFCKDAAGIKKTEVGRGK